MTVADVIADGLARAGTARVFGVGEGSVPAAMARRGVAVVPIARPDVACVMAAVSGTLTATPGAAVIQDFADAGVGLAYAYFDRAPTVVIGAGTSAARASALESVTKATLAVGSASAAHWIAHACQLVMTEPWGPVCLDVSPAIAEAPTLPIATSCRPAPLAAPEPDVVDVAVRRLAGAERPVVVAGRLCRSEADAQWLRAFAEARPAPVLVTPNARGVFPDPHPLLIGTLGGGDAERTLLRSADLIVAVGVDPLEVSRDPWPSQIPLVELTPLAPEASSGDRVLVVGDIGGLFEELAPRLRDCRFAEWDVARLHALKGAASAPPEEQRRLTAYRAVETARRLTPAGTIAVFEGGEVSSAAARAWQAVAPGELLISTVPATEGFAIAAAAAAQLARPERRVVCVTHPAALSAARDQLQIVAALGLALLIVVVGEPASSPLALPAGIADFTTASAREFGAALERALAGGRPAVLAPRSHDLPAFDN